MNQDSLQAYGELCSLFYDATEKYASEREVLFFSSWINQYPGRVLEAMSGSGRLQLPLMQKGYIVDGVDISYAMLARCKQRSAQLKLNPELYEQSLQNLKLPHRYHTVIIAVGSLQLIIDEDILLQSLKKLHAHMFVGAHLFIDIFEPDKTLPELSVVTTRLDSRSSIRLTRRHVFDMTKQVATTFCFYELIVDGVVQKKENELIEVFWRSDNQWQSLLHQAGFEMIKIYDERFKDFEPSRVIHAKSIVT